jgi:hypothetical protein
MLPLKQVSNVTVMMLKMDVIAQSAGATNDK